MGVSSAAMIAAVKRMRICAFSRTCKGKNTERCAHCVPKRVVEGLVKTIQYSFDEITRDSIFYDCTYREMTETIRQRMRSCFICDFKNSDECEYCPKADLKSAIMQALQLAHRKAIEEGSPIPTRRVLQTQKNIIKELYY